MSLVEDLKAAREWLTPPEHWTKNAYARDAMGVPVWTPVKPEAWARTCLVGACYKVAGSYLAAKLAVEAIRQCLPEPDRDDPSSMAIFNDKHSHEDVLALTDCAIDKAASS